MIIVGPTEVPLALTMSDAIRAVKWGYFASSSGVAVLPDRIHLSIPDSNDLTLVMPSYVPQSPDGFIPAALAVKTVSVFGRNPSFGLPRVLGGVLVLDPTTGNCVALLDGASLTAIRTAAGSAVATDLLANPEASTLAIFGAGGLSAAHIEAINLVRSIKTVTIFDRNPGKAEALAEQIRHLPGFPRDIRAASTPKEAVRNAEIICTLTTTIEPLFDPRDVAPGVHINAVGSYRATMQEVPSNVVCAARIFVDNLTGALKEAGDLVVPIREGKLCEGDIVGEIGALIAGSVEGRQSAEQITLFKSVGMATQDAVCGALATERAIQHRLGTQVPWLTPN